MPKNQTILALDPGFRELGFAVLRGKRLLEHGVEPLRFAPQEKRLGIARRLVSGLIRSHKPRALVLESTNWHPVRSINSLDRLGGSIRRLGKRKRLTVATYAPQTVRKALVGNGWATKKETALATCHRFPALRVYLTQDRKWKERYFLNMFDAVALALYHQQKRS